MLSLTHTLSLSLSLSLPKFELSGTFHNNPIIKYKCDKPHNHHLKCGRSWRKTNGWVREDEMSVASKKLGKPYCFACDERVSQNLPIIRSPENLYLHHNEKEKQE
jgi:hypothetical protein